MRHSATLLLGLLVSSTAAAAPTGPIIDVHRHAARAGSDDAAYRREVLKEMDENGIVLSLLHINEPTDLAQWVDAAPGRFVAGPAMPCWPNRAGPPYFCFIETEGWPDPVWLESELAAGRIGMLGEMLFNYTNVAPNDPRMEPYWALAEKYDVPVAVHTGRGPPPGAPPRDENCCPGFNESMGDPTLLRPVLRKHPNLRIILQHFGAGDPPDYSYFTDEALALLRDYPNVYLDMTIVNSIGPADAHEAVLKHLVEAGFGDRIMFGTDNLPAAPIIRRIEEIDWLTPEQRQAIYYGNAARFLRFDEATVRRHRLASGNEYSASDAAEKVERTEAELMASYNGGDPEHAASFYADDAFVHVPGTTPARGRPAIAENIKRYMQDPLFSLDYSNELTRLSGAGDMAYTRGRLRVTYTSPETEGAETVVSNYLLIFRREPNGSWKVAEDISF